MRLRLTILLSFTVLFTAAMVGFEILERELDTKYLTALEAEANIVGKSDIAVNRAVGSNEIWARENIYINTAALDRQGKGPFLKNQDYSARGAEDNNVVRILTVGDSYTYGIGVADPDMLWHRRVLQLLESEYPDTKIEMITLAKPGASLVEEVEWLSDDLLSRIDPDIIMFGHVGNDGTPSGRERAICGARPTCNTLASANLKEYTDCIAGAGSKPSKWIDKIVSPFFPLVSQEILLRYCDFRRIEREADGSSLQVDDRDDPYYPLFLKSVDRIANINKLYPVVSASLANGGMPTLLLNLQEELKSRGLRPVKHSLSIFDTTGVPLIGLMANPADSHPGNYVTIRQAKDIVRSIKQNHNGVFIQKNATDKSTSKSLVTSYLPVSLDVSQLGNGSVSIRSRPVDSSLYGLSNLYLEPQQTPCALIGQTHVRIMLDLNYTKGSKIQLDSISSGITIYAIGYNDEGVPTVRVVGKAEADSSFTFILEQGETGMLLSSADSIQCNPAKKLPAPQLSFKMSVI